MKLTILRVLLLVAPLLPTSFAQDTEDTRKTLIGYYGVKADVSVEGTPNDEVLKLLIRTQVELALRSAGIVVLRQDFADWSKHRALLNITVEAMKHPIGTMFYTIQVGVAEIVAVPTKPPARRAETALKADDGTFFYREGDMVAIGDYKHPKYLIMEAWKVGSRGFCPQDEYETLATSVRQHVDQFANAFLAANPKK